MGRATGTGKTNLSGLDAMRAALGMGGSALRGSLATLGGLGGDMTRLGYTLTGNEQPARGSTIFPDSSDMLRRMPNLPLDMRNEAYQSLGQFDPGIAAVAGAKGLAQVPKALMHGAESFARAQVPAQVVKGKGGNWLSGSIEGALGGLKKRIPVSRQDLMEELAGYRPGSDSAQRVQRELDQLATIEPLNSWIDKQLARYVKNEMATPEDPIRALAERGVLHVNPAQLTPRMGNLQDYGDARRLMGKELPARQWENAADSQVLTDPAKYFQQPAAAKIAEKNPWITNLPSDVDIHQMSRTSPANDLGFPHLTDELSNALNPASGLPQQLLIKDLRGMTVPAAVEHVSKINAWRAAQKAEADLRRANNAATQAVRDYAEHPELKGDYRWIELKAPVPGPDDPRTLAGGDFAKQYNVEERKVLEDALKYEGDTMGHCVGGYCPDVLSGKSRIFSLRNSKTGEPHVTVEVKPNKYENILTGQSEPLLDSIVQIKGKGNKAPVEKYLPYVQDFVKNPFHGGQWGDVGDLQNTGLYKPDSSLVDLMLQSAPDMKRNERLLALERAHAAGDLPKTGFVSREEWENALVKHRPTDYKQEGFSQGGAVTPCPWTAALKTG